MSVQVEHVPGRRRLRVAHGLRAAAAEAAAARAAEEAAAAAARRAEMEQRLTADAVAVIAARLLTVGDRRRPANITVRGVHDRPLGVEVAVRVDDVDLIYLEARPPGEAAPVRELRAVLTCPQCFTTRESSPVRDLADLGDAFADESGPCADCLGVEWFADNDGDEEEL